MLKVSYAAMTVLISAIWLAVRGTAALRQKKLDLRREGELLLVYLCLVVIVRFTFFPFFKVDGAIPPLVFDAAQVFPFRINLLPFYYLFDYPELRSALLNLFGNTAMFIPVGVVWPLVFRRLDTHKKVIAAGAGLSLCIEILQLPFFDRISDIDDLILNSLGYLMGYGLFLLAKGIKHRPDRRKTA